MQLNEYASIRIPFAYNVQGRFAESFMGNLPLRNQRSADLLQWLPSDASLLLVSKLTINVPEK